jgi:hypothetical protein
MHSSASLAFVNRTYTVLTVRCVDIGVCTYLAVKLVSHQAGPLLSLVSQFLAFGTSREPCAAASSTASKQKASAASSNTLPAFLLLLRAQQQQQETCHIIACCLIFTAW